MTTPTRAEELFARTGSNQFLGARLVSHAPDRVEVRMSARPEMAQEFGVVQGGFLTALADAATAYLLLPDAMDRGLATGIELKMNFLRPARTDGSDLVAVATPVKIGRTVAVFSVDITQGDRHVAHGTFTYLNNA